MEKLYTVSKNKTGSCGPDHGLKQDCGPDHGLLIAKFRLRLKKVRKSTGPFRYDLNQISYNYTVKVEKKIKGLYLIESTWMEVHNIVQEAVIEKHPQEKEMQKGTMVV